MDKDFYDGIDWVWFDLDDTLCDFHASSDMSLADIYKMYDLDRFFTDSDRWADIYHRHNSALWDLYNRAEITKEVLKRERFARPLAEGGVPPREADRLIPLLDRDYLKRLAANCRLIDGARELILHLRSIGKQIGILSNGFVEVQYDKIATCGITRLIDCVVLSDEIGVNKPDRRLYDYALEKSGATASRSLMIGDNPLTDIAGALNAGWHALLYCPAGDAADSPCPVVSSLSDAVKAVSHNARNEGAEQNLTTSKMVKD